MTDTNYNQRKTYATVSRVQAITILYLALASVACGVFLFFLPSGGGYELLPLVPVSFGIVCFIFQKTLVASRDRIGLLILQVTFFLRYVLIPIGMYITQEWEAEYVYDTTDYARQTAVWLMIYEIFIIYFALHIFMKISNKRELKRAEKMNTHTHASARLNGHVILLILASGGLIGFIFFQPDVLNRLYFYTIKITSDSHSVFNFELLLTSLKVLITSALLAMIYDKYQMSKSFGYLILSFGVGLISMGFITTDVRNLFLLGAVSILISIYFRFKGKYKKLITVVVAIVAVTTMTTISIVSNTQVQESTSQQEEWLYGGDLKKVVPMFQSYFSGVGNVAVCVDMVDNNANPEIGVSIKSDVFPSIFPLSITLPDRTTEELFWTSNYLFNRQANGAQNGGNLIMPLTGQAYYYFGWVGTPLLALVLLAFLVFFERKIKDLKNSRYAYSLIYLTCILGLMYMYNINITLRLMTTIGLPVLVITWLSYFIERLMLGNRKLNYNV